MVDTRVRNVHLVPHDPAWAMQARRESALVHAALEANLIVVHHIGSTAIPAIRAKPILDLMPVVESLALLDAARSAIEAAGYAWRGEYGLPGRRYCIKEDAKTGRRLIHAHCYAAASPEIERHLAFRDHLRRHQELARAYEDEKQRCQILHPDDMHAYTDCKNAWIKRTEAAALKAMHH